MIPIDSRVVEIMVAEDFDKEQILRAISNNRHNNVSTTYYLIKKKIEMKENIKEQN